MDERRLRCHRCKEIKNSTEFAPQPSSPRKFHYYCRKCATENTRQWRINNPEKAKKSFEKDRRRKRFAQYGISELEFLERLDMQNNSCAICKTEFNTESDAHIDHSHIHLNVRGLLCQDCNIGLGLFKDNTDLLQKAIEYLITNAL